MSATTALVQFQFLSWAGSYKTCEVASVKPVILNASNHNMMDGGIRNRTPAIAPTAISNQVLKTPLWLHQSWVGWRALIFIGTSGCGS